jgi:ribosome-binding protein aMBF1 (putative translation factor)
VNGIGAMQVSLSATKWGRVALLGFAYRHISFEFTVKARKQPTPKPLPTKVKTMADWIQIKLREKGMSPYHLGLKMGIAAAVVNGWKEGLTRPKACHIRQMVTILGLYGCPCQAES